MGNRGDSNGNMGTHNISSYERKSKTILYYASWPGAMINTH